MRAREAALDIPRIEAIRQKAGVPLVLHGSSGVKHESVVDAIEQGICKVNVATFLNQAFVRGMREGFEKYPGAVDPRKCLNNLSRECQGSGAGEDPPIQEQWPHWFYRWLQESAQAVPKCGAWGE